MNVMHATSQVANDLLYSFRFCVVDSNGVSNYDSELECKMHLAQPSTSTGCPCSESSTIALIEL